MAKKVESGCAHGDLQPSSVTCPECRQGTFEPARGRFGPVWRCTNRPGCKFYFTSRPTGAICDYCGAPMVEGTKTIPDRCSKRECPNRNPHRLAAAG